MTETEIKLRWEGDAASARAHIEAHGYRPSGPRQLEDDQLFDKNSGEVQGSGQALRLRVSGETATVTYKGRVEAGPYKSREEIEFDVSDAAAFETVLSRLGYQPTFRYQKFRTKFAAGEGIVTLDETPIGVFMELEGPKYWIDATALHLGFAPEKYLTAGYSTLYAAHKSAHPDASPDMVFRHNSVITP